MAREQEDQQAPNKAPSSPKVTELVIESGEPRETSPLICPHCSSQTVYKPVTWRYTRYEKQGHVFIANVYAYRCEAPCNMVYYLPDVSQEINTKLIESLLDTGLINQD